ncbi:hypothetical protein BB934_06750 [Microvirga ossetica]|uniref:Uncharacterized protein n=1 Tax=Microvirga ossetica TaxID=1882682 RepID=A0A1B2EDB5_9HYPH|nr:hypothetical protein [Microvirga ossetica]ANY77970.1 hypothetical protein BB934_06750 [Microvirga ossetica]
MPKDKDKKSSGKAKKASGKSSSSKLTKTVKKSGFMDLLNSSLGREILADALIAGAAAAAAALTKSRAAKKTGVAAASAQTPDLAQTAAGAVAGVVTEAARHFLPPSLVGEESESGATAKSEPKKVKYVQRSSDHSKRKTTKAKTTKAATAEKN